MEYGNAPNWLAWHIEFHTRTIEPFADENDAIAATSRVNAGFKIVMDKLTIMGCIHQALAYDNMFAVSNVCVLRKCSKESMRV